MEVSKKAYDLIKEFEGLSLTPYYCPSGKLTIGYGHTKNVTGAITAEQAEQLLKEDVADAIKIISKEVLVPLTENQYGALVSFIFNLGSGNFKKSTLLKLLNKGFYDRIPAQILRWHYDNGKPSGGLYRRRQAEVALWNS